jgi:integrase
MRAAAKVVELHQPSFSGKSVPMPTRPRNADVRTREYLTPDEVDRLMNAAGRLGRHGFRDKTMVLIGYRHGLRVCELVSLRWEQVDLQQGLLRVVRRKGGVDSTHPEGLRYAL